MSVLAKTVLSGRIDGCSTDAIKLDWPPWRRGLPVYLRALLEEEGVQMATGTTSPSIVRLHWAMEGGEVLVTPEDEDRFCIKVQRAIDILQMAHQAEAFTRQFNLLLRMLALWLQDRSAVRQAFLTQRDGALAFVVIREAVEYDDEFEDELSDLDYEIANDADLNLIKMDAMALPSVSDAAATSFLDPAFALQYVGHGDRSGPHSAGEQEP